jgi:hypothetical protein
MQSSQFEYKLPVSVPVFLFSSQTEILAHSMSDLPSSHLIAVPNIEPSFPT